MPPFAVLQRCERGNLDQYTFFVTQTGEHPEYHWLRVQGCSSSAGSAAAGGAAGPMLELGPSLTRCLGQGGPGAASTSGRSTCGSSVDGDSSALDGLLGRHGGPLLHPSAASVEHLVHDLQDVLEQRVLPHRSGASSGHSAASSAAVLQHLLGDLEAVGWDALEEMDESAVQLTLLHRDPCGREHRLRLRLPASYPAAPPSVATDLPVPPAFSWAPPADGPGCGPGRTGARAAAGAAPPGPGGDQAEAVPRCSCVADVYSVFRQAVSRHQALWAVLSDLDDTLCVLDPPPSVSRATRHLGRPTRRIALGNASLQLALDPRDPEGPPASAVFLGPPGLTAPLQQAYFDRAHEWSRDRGFVENLEALLMTRLPRKSTASSRGQQLEQRHGGSAAGAHVDEEPGSPDEQMGLAECPICGLHVLPLEGDALETGPHWLERAGDGSGQQGGGAAGGRTPDVACPTPACGRVYHKPCLAEWLQSLPDTRVSFNTLFGKCLFCCNPITVSL